MTRRILGAFVGVLALVIAAIVVPLGAIVTRQQADDFRAETVRSARAIAAVAEEHLDDRAPLTALTAVITRFAARGDRVAVLDSSGRLVTRGGAPLPSGVLTAAAAGRSLPDPGDAVVASADVRERRGVLGVAVVVRSTEPLDGRRGELWAILLAAAAGALLIGALVGWSLGRWISRPLTALAGSARGIGGGDETARAPTQAGPPEIREVGAAFNEMADRVAQLIEAQRGMTAEVSHQLRTPLAALRLKLELLAAELDPARAEDVEAMLEETNRLARLVDGLLAVARAEAAPSEPREVDVRAVAAARVEAWQPVAAERGIDLCLDAEPAVGLAGAGHTEQILDNLLDNAIEALAAGGRITVRVSSAGDGVRVAVVDNGPGMTAQRRAHALEQFVTDRAGAGGTGLGLAIVRRLAGSDHAAMQLRETPGGGLTAEITFPAVSAP